MRFPRVKADGQGFYHCVSRVVERRFIFQTSGHGSVEAERFIKLMRRLEAFSGIRVLTHNLVDVLGAQAILVPVFDETLGGVDHENALAVGGVFLVQHDDAGRDAGPVEEVGRETDDALDVTTSDDVPADVCFDIA
jgi:hypothetical protein